jgi:tetratricopeptide (TPR) repeat protein
MSFLIRTQWPEKQLPARDEEMTFIRQQVEAGHDGAAFEPATRLYRAQPRNAIYIEQLADIDRRLGRFKEEAELWEQFLQYSPVPIEGCPQIGTAYRRQGLNDRAVDALKRCLQIEERNPDILFALGSAYEAEGERPLAEQTYRKGLALAPNDADLVLGMGRMDLRAGRVATAADAAARVLDRIPDNSDALLLAALAAMGQGNLAAARTDLEKGARISPRYSDIHLALGRLDEGEKNLTAARQQYREALALDPANSEAGARLRALPAEKP